MEFRTLICAALGFAIAGAVVSTEISVPDYWVPLSFGIIGLVFAVGALAAAGEESQSVVVPILAIVIAGFAILQGFQGRNDFSSINNELDRVEQQLQEQLDSMPNLTP